MKLQDAEIMATKLIAKHGLEYRFRFNKRLEYALGRCFVGLQLIELNPQYVELNEENEVRDTILHEIAHALAGKGHHHDDYWRRICLRIGGSGNRTGDSKVMLAYRYRAICPSCGEHFYRHKAPSGVHFCTCRKTYTEANRLDYEKGLWTQQ